MAIEFLNWYKKIIQLRDNVKIKHKEIFEYTFLKIFVKNDTV